MRAVAIAVISRGLLAGVAFAQKAAVPAKAPGAAPAAAPVKAPSSKEAAGIASYAVGMNMGRSFKSEGMDLDLEGFLQGIRDGLAGAKAKYSEEQLRAAVEVFQKDMMAKQEERQKTVGERNKQEGVKFLAANKTKAGVKALASGLQYQVLQSGKGATPKASDTVKVHYEGTLLDGTVFDSSVQRKQPATLQVNGVIPGWTEALQLMKVGDKWRLFIPAELAYGAQGAGNVIGPNSVLVFEVELLSVEPAAAGELRPRVRP